MWVLEKEELGVLWIEFETDERTHFLLPVFTSPDTAMEFVGDLDYKGNPIRMRNIGSVAMIDQLIEIIQEQGASAIMLDPPNPDSIKPNTDIVYWAGPEFIGILEPIIEMSKTYGEKPMLDILATYLNSKIRVTPE